MARQDIIEYLRNNAQNNRVRLQLGQFSIPTDSPEEFEGHVIRLVREGYIVLTMRDEKGFNTIILDPTFYTL